MQVRVASSLGELEGTHQEVWGTTHYNAVGISTPSGSIPNEAPTVFFGLYGLPDFYTLWRHEGKKYILWAGSDIRHFVNGYWLEDGGNIRLDPKPLADWIEKNCESWVENEVERKALEEVGITAQICPSFMGNVEDYEIEYEPAERPQVYVSVSGNDFELYGWDIVEKIADQCEVDFHLYGNTEPWETKHSNVFVHGRVSKEQMNEEIKKMQCGLRLCSFDGFSEVLAKSVLWGQYPVTFESFGYKHIDGFRNLNHLVQILNRLKYKVEPNIEGRNYYLKTLNQYPWNQK